MGITHGTLVKQGRVWHWKYRLDGEIRWESLKVGTKREAELVRQERTATFHNDRSQFSRGELNPTIDEFNEEYFEWCAAHKRPNTVAIERRYWKQLTAFTKARRLGDITQRKVESFKAKLKRKGASGKPLADESVNDVLRHVQAIFNHATKLKLFDGENPVQGVARFKITRTAPDFLSEDEMAALLETAEAHSEAIHWVFLLGLYAGLRKNEIVNCRWEWFDTDKPGKPILRVLEHGDFVIKDYEERPIPLASKIADVILPHSLGEGYLFESTAPNKGKWRYRYEPQRAFNTVKLAAKVPKANFLLLRHSFATWHIINGTPIAKVSRWLGHAKIDTTMKHYAGLLTYDDDIENF
jgi:integrase